MGFLGVYAALYDYAPQSDQEISFQEGDLLYLLEKSAEDEWWKAKRKRPGHDGEEPVGLIPSTYIEEAEPSGQARALYDYTRQTDEEISLTEDAALAVYDNSDPDWILVGFEGEYGFAPANYIELRDAPSRSSSRAMATVRPETTTVPANDVEQPPTPASPVSTSPGPAATLASIMQRKASAPVSPSPPLGSSSSPDQHPDRPIHTPEASDDEFPPPPPAKETTPAPAPSLPKRPVVQTIEPRRESTISEQIESPRVVSSPPFNRAVPREREEAMVRSPGAFHLYNISEMVSVMGKRKKMPTTLGINSATGTIMISPESSRDGPQQEWTGEKLVHYSIEGKHVFMELVRPSKSVDFHAGAKDTAEEIVSALGEIAGAVKAAGLREVLAAADEGVSKGQVLYDFVAQGDDEVTVGVGDQVVILDDSKSDEWWMVRRLKDGKEGVMPSSYVEVTRRKRASATASKSDPLQAGRSITEQNRQEEQRLAKEAAKSSRPEHKRPGPSVDIGLGVALPQRGSSLMIRNNQNAQASPRDRRESRTSMKVGTTKSKPDASRTRTWTDRSGSFKVEAEFIGCSEGKIHLHKLNGVKIAVPVVKMATQDLEFVERITGMSLDEDKPLSEIKRRSQNVSGPEVKALASPTKAASTSRKPDRGKDEYDWFDFFLKCGVSPQLCERYASSFTKDSMDESVLPDITSEVLRTLGLKEGDILKVMKYLDTQFGRTGANRAKRNVSFGGAEVMRNGDESGHGKISSPTSSGGGLFSGPGGALRNNTRKGRPAPAIQTKDVVDPKVFEQSVEASVRKASVVSEAMVSPTTTPATAAAAAAPPPPVQKDPPGFEDDAWDVKPARAPRSVSGATRAAPISSAPAPQSQPAALTGSMKDLALLSSPIETSAAPSRSQPAVSSQPTGAPALMPALIPLPPAPAPAPVPASNQFGASTVAPGPGTLSSPQRNAFPSGPAGPMGTQPTGYGTPSTQSSVPARLRPQPPPQPAQNQGAFALPPPPRPLSAPQNNSLTSGFTPPPIQPQLTGVQGINSLQLRAGPTGPTFNNPSMMTGQQQFAQPPFSQPPSNLQISTLPPQMTGMTGMMGIGPSTTGLIPQPTGFMPSQQPGPGFMSSQPFSNGPSMNYGPFNQNSTDQMMPPLSMQPTGAPTTMSMAPPMQQPLQTGNINNFLPPALPLQQQRTGFGTAPTNIQQSFPPPPPIPQQPTIAPLVPQKTGPAPPVRFGIQPEAKKLTPQPTGRRANLSQATPQNPFGF
ncbi:MAG: hypothetical protein M1823_001901 [Watsoniomyces obsoletus]|nr:MAG: hypothetical protein M1823_001901 [Watsoniomyces obsoletus]